MSTMTTRSKAKTKGMNGEYVKTMDIGNMDEHYGGWNNEVGVRLLPNQSSRVVYNHYFVRVLLRCAFF